jgi:primosomal protein N'
MTDVKIRCENCDTWNQVSDEERNLECRCGAVFAVTVTRILPPPA